MYLPYRVLLAGYRSTADTSPVVGVSSSDCTTQVADEVGDAVPVSGIFKPDLIILYDLMPECGALQVMKRLKRDPDTEDFPVILIVPVGYAQALVDDPARRNGRWMGSEEGLKYS